MTVETRAETPAPFATRDTKLRPRLLGSRLFALARLMSKSAHLTYAREVGLSEFEWATLMVIGDNAPLSLNALAELMERNAGQLSRSTSSLEAKGLVSRVLSGYKRGVRITLTPPGETIFQRLSAVALERNARLMDGLDDREVAVIMSALNKIERNAADMLDKEIERNLA